MSLRVTQEMLYGQALADIRRSMLDRVRLQQQVATGRRVSRPSDDPAAALRILPLRARIRDLEQVLDNSALARESLDGGAAALEEASGLMQRLRELTLAAGNASKSDADRKGMAADVDQLLQQMLGLANSKRGASFLFGGARSDTQPFVAVNDAGGTRVRYQGDQNTTSVEVAPGVSTALNVAGDRVFQVRQRGATTFQGTTGAAPSGASDSGVGFDTLLVTFAGLRIPGGTTGVTQGTGTTTALGPLSYVYTGGATPTLSINGGPATAITGGNQSFPVGTGGPTAVSLNVTVPIVPPTGTITSQANLSIDGGASTVLVDEFVAKTEYQVKDSFAGTVLNVNVAKLNATGSEQVTHAGTFDVFTVLVAVRDTLRNDAGLPRDAVQKRLTSLLGEIDSAHDAVLAGVHDLGVRSEHMQLMNNRVEGLKLGSSESLSLAQDADLAESILALAQQDYGFQASLGVAARILQTSLLQFLR